VLLALFPLWSVLSEHYQVLADFLLTLFPFDKSFMYNFLYLCVKIKAVGPYIIKNFSAFLGSTPKYHFWRLCPQHLHLPSPDRVSGTAFPLPSVIRHCRRQSSESCWKLICLFKGRGAGDLWTGALEMYWLTNPSPSEALHLAPTYVDVMTSRSGAPAVVRWHTCVMLV